MEKILTLTEAANYLQVSTGKLYRMAEKGRIPASKVGGSWRFKQSRIDDWFDELEKANGSKRKRG